MSTGRIITIALVVWIEMLRKKDIYVLLILLSALLFALLSVDIFGMTGVAGYVKDLGLLSAWIFAWILATTISARQLPDEEKRGTIYALLAKPVTRLELILGKWVGAWSVVCFATLCLYALITLVVQVKGGGFRPQALLQGYMLHTAALAVICAIALALSTRMTLDAAVTFCLVLTGTAFLLLPRVPDLLVRADLGSIQSTSLLALYAIFPHFELFDMRQRLVYETSVAQWNAVALVLYYGIHMTAVFLLAAWLGYTRKKFSRGETA